MAACDCLKQIQALRNALGTAKEILSSVKDSPKRTAMLKNIKLEDLDTSAGLSSLCATRWTVKAKSLNSIKTNYKQILKLYDQSLEEGISNSETRAKIIGNQSQMYTFDFYFSMCIAIEVIGQSDILARALQNPNLSASEGKILAENTILTLKAKRSDEKFELFWNENLEESKKLEISDPVLKRIIKPPARFVDENAPTVSPPQTPKEYYKRIYFEAIDKLVNLLENRFNQEDFKIIENLQNLLLLAAGNQNYDKELKFVLNFYNSDFNENELKSQLQAFSIAFSKAYPNKENILLSDLKKFFKELSPAFREYLSEVCKAMKLILVLPATNSSSERSFSVLRSLKDYQKSTMGQERLNHFMIFAIYPEYVDQLDMVEIAKEFVSRNENRKRVFGRFEL